MTYEKYVPPPPPQKRCPSCQGTGCRPLSLQEVIAKPSTGIPINRDVYLCLVCLGRGTVDDV